MSMENTRELLMKVEETIEAICKKRFNPEDYPETTYKEFEEAIVRQCNLHEALSKVLRAKER
jgi:hypothetical protein